MSQASDGLQSWCRKCHGKYLQRPEQIRRKRRYDRSGRRKELKRAIQEGKRDDIG